MPQQGLRGGQPTGDLLGVLLVVPETGRTGLLLQACDSLTQVVHVDRLGDRLENRPSLVYRLHYFKVCHHYHHTVSATEERVETSIPSAGMPSLPSLPHTTELNGQKPFKHETAHKPARRGC
jgi:hypothetical protein